MAISALVLIILWISSANGDLEGDTRALLAFKNAVGGRMQWDSNSNTCEWRGIKCSNARVDKISLPASELSGTIPPFTLGNLTQLRILRLRFNVLRGPIPHDLVNCRELRSLYLQDNLFSGPLPANFSVWPNLSRLNLAHNNFTGRLPDSLNDLKRLGTILVENNSLTGPLPPLNLPNLKQFNVSYNNFTGPVPESLKHFLPDSFFGNSLCNSPLTPCNNSNGGNGNSSGGAVTPNGGKDNDESRRIGIIVGIVVGSVVLVGLIVGILVMVRRRKSRDGEKIKKKGPKFSDGEKPIDDSFTKEEYSISVQEPEKRKANLVFFASEKEEAQFSLEDLLRASAELLGKGSVGTAYRAVLEMGMTVVVKRLKDVGIGHRDFTHQIQMMGKMKHKNLVPLRAYYYSFEEKLLVYDYMPRGSLSALLHGNREIGRLTLDWRTRVHIALGTAKGIEYLHKQSSKICHGNIKSSNILVTNNYDGCVGDFGLVQMVSNSPAATTTLGNKSLGYTAPEVIEIRKVSQKADVYSFGVLILELLTGKAPTQASLSDDGVDLPRWVQSVVEEEWTSEVLDMDLIKQHGDSMDEEGMLQLLQVGMQCVALYPDQRPTMSQVVKMIQDLSPTSPEHELKSLE